MLSYTQSEEMKADKIEVRLKVQCPKELADGKDELCQFVVI